MRDKIFKILWKILNKYFKKEIRTEFKEWKREEERPKMQAYWRFGATPFSRDARVIVKIETC